MDEKKESKDIKQVEVKSKSPMTHDYAIPQFLLFYVSLMAKEEGRVVWKGKRTEE